MQYIPSFSVFEEQAVKVGSNVNPKKFLEEFR